MHTAVQNDGDIMDTEIDQEHEYYSDIQELRAMFDEIQHDCKTSYCSVCV